MTILNSIGNTPTVGISGVKIKLEHLNPSGSVKDRIAKYIVEKAEKEGILKRGYTIIEATSGNTGIAFSFVASIKGYKMVAVMPNGMSREREQIMKAYGAEVVFSEKGCVKCAVEIAERLSKKPKCYMPRQFENKWNVEEHEKNMGKEIIKQSGKVGCFVAGVGTGGTLIGVGKALKKENPDVQLVAVEPAECALLSGEGYGKHKIFGLHKGFTCSDHRIEGIGDGFIPKIIQNNGSIEILQ